MLADKKTGYPSKDRPWLKYYEDNAEGIANNIPNNKTVWDVIEESLYKYIDIPALEYFGRIISREEFLNDVYIWAKALKKLGIEENEVVPYYGPFMPDICAMIFAMNMIGACPYFLKLAISPEALAEETKDCRFAIVFDQMWENVSAEFSKDRFKTVVIAKITDAMPSPKKQIVTVLSQLKGKTNLPKGQKYVSLIEAKRLAKYYSSKEIKARFTPNRPSFITSSSGTTINGIVKGTVATNESTISQLYMGKASGIQYFPGDRCLNHFPPTASTSLNVLFFLALYNGETVVIDPRVSEKDFYNQLIKLKPNMALTTGSAWEAFFNRVAKEKAAGKSFDFSYAKGWTVGGEGTDCKKFKRWNEIMSDANSYNLLFSGYGSSELFSATSVETINARYDFSKQIMSVGIPYAGIVMGVFDSDGKELPYNTRGELRIKSKSAMKEYYNKPEITQETKVDGWIRTGDLAEIDDNGFVFIWGRVNDAVRLKNGQKLYLFDIANKIKENDCIIDAMVIPMPLSESESYLAAHIVWADNLEAEEKRDCLERINNQLQEYLPDEISVSAFAEHEEMLPYSPTTLKKDKNRMAKQTEGYIQIDKGILKSVNFVPMENGYYQISIR